MYLNNAGVNCEIKRCLWCSRMVKKVSTKSSPIASSSPVCSSKFEANNIIATTPPSCSSPTDSMTSDINSVTPTTPNTPEHGVESLSKMISTRGKGYRDIHWISLTCPFDWLFVLLRGICTEGRRAVDLLTSTTKIAIQHLLLEFVDLSVDQCSDAKLALQQMTTSFRAVEGISQTIL